MFQKDLFKGKKILVTGGGTGLGKTMASKYLQLGADIYICGRNLLLIILVFSTGLLTALFFASGNYF